MDQKFLSTNRNKTNMWPDNEGTGGGRQQALDAKQPLLTGSRKSQADKTNRIITSTGRTPLPGEEMNLLNLIRANWEPSLLTVTTKEFVTGSKTNQIS